MKVLDRRTAAQKRRAEDEERRRNYAGRQAGGINLVPSLGRRHPPEAQQTRRESNAATLPSAPWSFSDTAGGGASDAKAPDSHPPIPPPKQ